ncbi:ETC complex I subunit conserved region-domain-containing protein [Xylariomycetidae sp. FL0641]|nr:ETC complex I subunit conserved region-domain-containing protein [Xylariomycetidae sp. FL0641]
MRSTLRLFAAVKPARYLEAGAPTGLTGLHTHSSPRSTLLWLYGHALDKLAKFPESSLYRQSVEAMTKHRMAMVEAAEPPGHAAWAARAKEVLRERGREFTLASSARVQGADAIQLDVHGRAFVHRANPQPVDERYLEWDGEPDVGEGTEGLRGPEEREIDHEFAFNRRPVEAPSKVEWEPEPQLTADQITELESKIGHGLIEEVIQAAEGELRLMDILYENKAWEDLEEKPPAGQWEYFERQTGA